jgi:glyoxylase-like metal-dependent hydrolase (beta-lactamase superfamily II)
VRVTLLRGSSDAYTGNAYAVLGDHSRPEDVNTLVDTGTDGSILAELEALSTGIGHERVQQVLLTHAHFDHTGGLPTLRASYPRLKAFAFDRLPGVDETLYDGRFLRVGDRDAKVLHTPGHSEDSVAIYVPEERALFSGDTQVDIKTAGGAYPRAFVRTLERLIALDVRVIYPGHGEPMRGELRAMMQRTLASVLASELV